MLIIPNIIRIITVRSRFNEFIGESFVLLFSWKKKKKIALSKSRNKKLYKKYQLLKSLLFVYIAAKNISE